MVRWKRPVAGYGTLFVAVLVVFVAAYHFGMIYLEGERHSVWQSLQVVVETFTTVGYGSHAGWSDPAMNVLVVAMNLASFVVVFMALPLVVVPLLEEALESAPPTELPDAEDHVLVAGFTDRGETLLEELSARDVDYAVLVGDRETATALHGSGVPVVFGQPDSTDGLRSARAGRTRAVVVDADDQTNASVVLAAREVAPGATVVATAVNPDDARYLEYAGADAVLTPRHALGTSLAETVTMTASGVLDGPGEVGDDFEIAEVSVAAGADVAGQRLADSGIRERTGANVIGAWHRGEFVTPLTADHVVRPRSVLLAAGTVTQVEQVRQLVSAGAESPTGHVVVIGYGEVGRTVTSELAAAGVPYRVVDRTEAGGVDVVGDATDEATLSDADVADARAVIIAIPGDTETAYATLIARELAPDAEIVARADEVDAEAKLYRAGADYVLSVATVSGRMLASEVTDEEVVTPDKQVEVIRAEAPALAGRSLRESDLRGRTGCTAIAIDRGGTLVTDVGPETVIREGDEVVVAGSDESVRAFERIRR